MGLPRWQSDKESACQCRRCKRHGFNRWVGKITWSGKWQPTPGFLPVKSHGQRSLMGCSPRGRRVGRYRATKHTCVQSKARLPRWLSGKESACQCRRCKRHGFDPWVAKIPWKRNWQPTPAFLRSEEHTSELQSPLFMKFPR